MECVCVKLAAQWAAFQHRFTDQNPENYSKYIGRKHRLYNMDNVCFKMN